MSNVLHRSSRTHKNKKDFRLEFGQERMSENHWQEKSCFRMKTDSILTVYINDRIYAPNREQADENGGIHRKTKFPQGVMVWLGVCYDGVTRPVIIENGTINHQ
ncbi:unnamed protein product, partial [Didymodactylos carnosus]